MADPALLNTLQAAIGLLGLKPTDPLRQDIHTICSHLQNPNFRIAVFGPFNYGKSTLLNALLGDRTLPIDLIPTTGAAIVVKYGPVLQTRIQLTDGQELTETGTELLSRFAVLDGDRCMRNDVAAVEVCCPHPFLRLGVEFVDLPGTDDQEAQDALVKNQLLTADLVVQVLDARKLMTLQERETLRDWLLDRGIETVLFVVNFLNLLEPDQQKQVFNRLRFVAESFRSKLPPGISNLYRVDALPALRAQLKGDSHALQTSGLPALESALQAIVQTQSQQPEVKQARLQVILQQVQQTLQNRIEQVQQEIQTATITVNSTEYQRQQIQRKALTLIERGFTQSMAQLRDWLTPEHLMNQYTPEAIAALRRSEFGAWETDRLKPEWLTQKRLVTEWLYKACEFLDRPRPTDPSFSFPEMPVLPIPESSSSQASSGGTASTYQTSETNQPNDTTPVAIATGLGWVLGGPLGAAVLGGASYLLNQQTNRASEAVEDVSNPSDSLKTDSTRSDAIYAEAMQDYFSQLSAAAQTALNDYETSARRILKVDWEEPPVRAADSDQHHLLTLLQTTLEQLKCHL